MSFNHYNPHFTQPELGRGIAIGRIIEGQA
jgi:hypothetical protein